MTLVNSIFPTFRNFIAGSFHLLHMLLEDYILYTVENHNNADEQLIQSSTCSAKGRRFVEGKFLLTQRNIKN